MRRNSTIARAGLPAIAMALALPISVPASAQEGEGLTDEVIIVVGSRRQDRSAADSPVPVDIIGSEELRNLGDTDMDALLATLVPSYNVDTQPISDAATVIRPASLRGLPSDATLVLVNGKRRHRGSIITWLGGGISDGAHGPDVSAIPSIALDRVEVLRDGASAQYGSDAIAGVINFVLREDPEGGTLEGRWGRNYEGDGASMTVAGNFGLPITDAGFLNLSGEFRQVDPTSRSVQRTDAQTLIDAGNLGVRQPAAQIWGAPEVSGDYKLFANAGIEISESSELYAFANYAERKVEGGFFFRNPHTRAGVFRGPGLEDGTPTVKVADLSEDGMSGNCPALPIVDNVADADAFAAVAGNPNCFTFLQRFPGGFTPQFGGDVEDMSAAVGLRGELANDWFYDISAVFGANEVSHFMHNTINPQLAREGVDIPTTYYPGTYREEDTVFDISLSKPLDLGMANPLHTAFGFEYRTESFERKAGDENSWYIDDRLAMQGFGIGSNGFPGLAPRNAGEESRSSYAAYVDLETNVSDQLLLGGAVRFEDYEDFGNTFDGKIAMRYQVTDAVALRGAFSTGFRAPTLGQTSVRNVSTVFGANGLEDRATLPPTNPISVLKGGQALQPEESTNLTLGLAWTLGTIDITLDYYNIDVEKRIAQSSTLALSADDINALLAQGVSDASSFASVRFFTNQFDTTTSGIDLVVTAPLNLGGGDTTLILTGNSNDTEVTRRDPEVIGDFRVKLLENALPGNRFSASLNHLVRDWRFLLRLRHYGEFYGAPADVESWAKTYESRFMVDAEVGYSFSDALTIVAGAQNLLDEYPEETTTDAQNSVGMRYPENSPYGFNGGFYYLRAVWDFN